MRQTFACLALFALLPLALAEEPQQEIGPAVKEQFDGGRRYYVPPRLHLELMWTEEQRLEKMRRDAKINDVRKSAIAKEKLRAKRLKNVGALLGAAGSAAVSRPYMAFGLAATGATIGLVGSVKELRVSRVGDAAVERHLRSLEGPVYGGSDYSLLLSYGRETLAVNGPGEIRPAPPALQYNASRLAGILVGDALGTAANETRENKEAASRKVQELRLQPSSPQQELEEAVAELRAAERKERQVLDEIEKSQARAEQHALETADYAKKMFLAVDQLRGAAAKRSLAESRRRFGQYDHVARSLAALEAAATGSSDDLETLDEVAAVLDGSQDVLPTDLQKKYETVVETVRQFDQHMRATFELTDTTLDTLSNLAVISDKDLRPIREALAVSQQLYSTGFAVTAGFSSPVQPMGYMQAATAALSLFGLGENQEPDDARVMAYLEGMMDEMRANHAETMDRLEDFGVNMNARFTEVDRQVKAVRRDLQDLDDKLTDFHYADVARFEQLKAIGEENNKLLQELTKDVADLSTSVFLGRLGEDSDRQWPLKAAYALHRHIQKSQVADGETYYDFMSRVFKEKDELFRSNLFGDVTKAFLYDLPRKPRLGGDRNGERPQTLGAVFWGSDVARSIPGKAGPGDAETLERLDRLAREMYVQPYRYYWAFGSEPSLTLDLCGGDLPQAEQRNYAEFLRANAGILVSVDRVLDATEAVLAIVPFMGLVHREAGDPIPQRLLTLNELAARTREEYEDRAEDQRDLLLQCRGVLDVAIVQLSILHGADLAPRMAADVPALLKLDAARRNAAREDRLASEIARLQPNLARLSERLERRDAAAKTADEAADAADKALAGAVQRRDAYADKRELDKDSGTPRGEDRRDRGWSQLDAVVKRWEGRAGTLRIDEREATRRADHLREVVDGGKKEVTKMEAERKALKAAGKQEVAVPARVDHIAPALENNPWVRENFVRALVHARLVREGNYWGRLARYHIVLGRTDPTRLPELLGDDLPFERRVPDGGAEGEPESWHLMLDGQSIPLPPAEDVDAGATAPPPLLPELLDARRRVDAALDDVNFPLRQAEVAGVAQR